MKNKGFSAVELLFVLAISVTLLIMVISGYRLLTNHSRAADVAQNAVLYSQAANRYIKTHSSLLQELLSYRGNSNGKIVTLPMQVLKNEKFLSENYPIKNSLNQYPCVVVTWANNQLQGFLYYRDDVGNTKTLTKDSLYAGVKNSGAMLGIYSDGVVNGARGGWELSGDDINDLFSQTLGSADPSSNDPDRYRCSGSRIANNSYIVNMTMEQPLNNQLPKDDNIHLYADVQNDIDSVQNSNTLNDDLNLDFQDTNGEHKKSSLIFQNNPDCVMDPSKPATMQDYNPGNAKFFNQANIYGCRNKQLAIQESEGSLFITGFQQADPRNSLSPYVGELQVASFQPTAQVDVGKPCYLNELGKMAQQKDTNSNDDINNLYISQVQCMRSPLCDKNTNGVCYMPIQTITIQFKTKEDDENPTAKLCPAGMFVASYQADLQAPRPNPCCGSNLGISYCCHIDPCNKDNRACSSVESTDFLSSTNPILYRGVITTPSHWYQGCPEAHSGCGVGWDERGITYVKLYSVVCTNDISKANFRVLAN